MKSRIKHVGITSQNAARLLKFYECLFDLRRASTEASLFQEAERGRSFGYPVLAPKRVASPFDHTVIASDDNIGVAFNRRRGSRGQLPGPFEIEVRSPNQLAIRYFLRPNCNEEGTGTSLKQPYV